MRFRVTFDWVIPDMSKANEAGHQSLKAMLERCLTKELVWFEDYRVENIEMKSAKDTRAK